MKNIWIMAFLVTWRLAHWVSDPCPDAGKINEYGNPIRIGCLVYHAHCEYEERSKEFITKEDAEEFIKNAPNNASDFVIKELKK